MNEVQMCAENLRVFVKTADIRVEIFDDRVEIILPKVNSKTDSTEAINNAEKHLNEDERKIMKFVKSTGRITRKEAEEILSLKKTQTVQILGGMLDKGVLLKVGAGRNTSYIANV